MAAVNKVILIGNITRDPELRYTPKGTAVTEIGLAVNRKFRVENEMREEVTFVDITYWGAQAETISKFVQKGSPIYVEGRLQLDSWDDKNSGQKRSKLRVVGEGFQFLGGRSQDGSGPIGGGGSQAPGQSQPQSYSSPPAPTSEPSSKTGPGPMPAEEEDDDIPF